MSVATSHGMEIGRSSTGPKITSSVDAILMSSFEQNDSDDSDETRNTAQKKPPKAAGDAVIDRTQDTIRWGNAPGLTILEQHDEMRADIRKLKSEITTLIPLKSGVETLKSRVETLETEVSALKLTTDSYMNVRSRFFAVFLRDHSLRCSPSDYEVIKNGNTSAHEGDPLVDATMFKKRVRSDDKTFSLLYGISWQRVFEYGTCLFRL